MSDTNTTKDQIITVFKLDEQNYGLYISAVERVVSTVEITPLPKAPDIVMGVINFHGDIIPVINIRKRFNLPVRKMKLEDKLIIAKTAKRLVALVVDSVTGVHEMKQSHFVDIKESFQYTNYLSGIAKVEDNIVLIHDLEKFLSLEEQQLIDKAL